MTVHSEGRTDRRGAPSWTHTGRRPRRKRASRRAAFKLLLCLVTNETPGYLRCFPLLNPRRKSLCFSERKREQNEGKRPAFCSSVSLKPVQAGTGPGAVLCTPPPGLDTRPARR